MVPFVSYHLKYTWKIFWDIFWLLIYCISKDFKSIQKLSHICSLNCSFPENLLSYRFYILNLKLTKSSFVWYVDCGIFSTIFFVIFKYIYFRKVKHFKTFFKFFFSISVLYLLCWFCLKQLCRKYMAVDKAQNSNGLCSRDILYHMRESLGVLKRDKLKNDI